jgi:hypothetical protein
MTCDFNFWIANDNKLTIYMPRVVKYHTKRPRTLTLYFKIQSCSIVNNAFLSVKLGLYALKNEENMRIYEYMHTF